MCGKRDEVLDKPDELKRVAQRTRFVRRDSYEGSVTYSPHCRPSALIKIWKRVTVSEHELDVTNFHGGFPDRRDTNGPAAVRTAARRTPCPIEDRGRRPLAKVLH